MPVTISVTVEDSGEATLTGTGDALFDLNILLSTAMHILNVMRRADDNKVIVPQSPIGKTTMEALWQMRGKNTLKTG